MKLIFIVVGAVLGMLVVRGFMLDPIEEIGWRLFWEALFKGHISMDGMRKVLGSATFAKSGIGMAVGAIVGLFATTLFATARTSGK